MRSALRPFRLRLLVSHSGTSLALALAAASGGAALLVAVDALLALPLAARLALAALFALGVLGLALAGPWRALRTSDDRVAWLADRGAGRRDHGLLSALQLSRLKPADELQAGLIAVQVASAREAARGVDPAVVVPAAAARRSRRILLWTLLAALGFFGLFVPVAEAVIPRYLDPFGDHPPYSRLGFALEPAELRVDYGGSAALSARVTGGDPGVVALVTADDGGRQRTVCFRGEDGRYSQKVENLTKPLVFWFEAGSRARSRRGRLTLALTPRLTGLEATVRAPAYARLAPRTVNVGAEPLRMLPGSEIELLARSNRPLEGGVLRLVSAGGAELGSWRGVPAGKPGECAVRFRWPVSRGGELELRLRDVDGVEGAPVRLGQELLPDRPPEVTVSEPPPVCLATPDSVIRLAAAAADDYGVARLGLIRGLKGFRDRERELAAPPERPRQIDHNGAFDFANLGVVPGDEVEFYLEAQDANPSGAGVGSSAVGRIVIISKEQYLEIARSKARLEDFRERYRAVADEMRRLAEGAEEARQMMRQGRDKEAEARLGELQGSARGLSAYLAAQCAALPLYEIEKDYQRELEVLRKETDEAAAKLTPEDLEEAVKMLKGGQEEYAPMLEGVELLAEAAEVMALQGEFVRLYHLQKELAGRLRRFEERPTLVAAERATMEALSGEQAAVQRDLERFMKDLREKAGKLPEELAKLKQNALAFGDEVEKAGITPDMEAAAKYARALAGAEAAGRAQLAAEKMEKLVAKCDGVPQNGGGGWCQGFRPSEGESLRQLLQARGLGPGMNLGSRGSGAAGSSGYSMGSNTLENVHAYGPGTTGDLRRGGAGQGGAGRGGTEPVRVVSSPTGPAVRPGEPRGFRFNPAAGFPRQYRKELVEYFKLLGRMENEEEKP